MNEVISKNDLTVEEHVQRIQHCLDQTRRSILKLLFQLKNVGTKLEMKFFKKKSQHA